MREPKRNQLRIETEALGVRVRDTGKVLEAHKRDTSAVDNQLTGIRGAHSDHEYDIVRDIDVEQGPNLLLRLPRQRDHIGAREERKEVVAIRVDRGGDDVLEMRP